MRTQKQLLSLAGEDLDTATAALSLRYIAGDETMLEGVADRAVQQWRKRSSKWLAELSRRVESRHASAGEVAFLLEPDVKEGRGGLRDVHALRWAQLAREVLLAGDDEALVEAEDLLLDVRVELHRAAKNDSDTLLLLSLIHI